ncbi:MAG: hypothetical protein U0W24_03025 [Bacteroidales bacterium]
MVSIAEVIVEIILLYGLQYPGAFIRWMLTGFKKPYKEIIESDAFFNGTVGVVTFGLLIALTKLIL